MNWIRQTLVSVFGRIKRNELGTDSLSRAVPDPIDRAQVLRLVRDAQHASDQLELISDQRIDRFRLIERLGAGAMGEVWEAVDTSLQRRVALKLIPAFSQESDIHEAILGGRINHPNTVHVYSAGVSVDWRWISQELIPNGTTLESHFLERHCEPHSGSELKEITRRFTSLAEGLAAAHRRDVVHRDIKPSNILISDHQEWKLGDFGLARLGRTHLGNSSNSFSGTIAYSSPESLTNESHEVTASIQSDLFSFGVCLYECLTLRHPFEAQSADAWIKNIQECSPIPPHRVNARISADLSAICMQCLDPSPSNRYRTADDLAKDLRLSSEGLPVSARPLNLAVQSLRSIRKHPYHASTLIAGALAITLTVAFVQSRDAVNAQERSNTQAAVTDLLQDGTYWMFEGKNIRRAVNSFEKAKARSDEPNPRLLALYATSLVKAGRHDEAEELVEQDLVPLLPELDMIRVRSAMLEAAHKHSEAEAHLGAVSNPITALGWSLEGLRLLARAEKTHAVKEAEALYVKSSQAFSYAIMQSKQPDRYDVMSYAHAMSHLPLSTEERKSVIELVRTHSLSTDPRAFFWVGNLGLGSTELLEQTITSYETAIEQGVEETSLGLSTHINLASVLRQAGRPKDAVPHYRRATQFDPDFARARGELGSTLYSLGHKVEGLSFMRAAANLELDDHFVRTHLGLLLIKEEKYEEAEAYLEEALAIAPDFARAKMLMEHLRSLQSPEGSDANSDD